MALEWICSNCIDELIMACPNRCTTEVDSAFLKQHQTSELHVGSCCETSEIGAI